MSSFMPMSGNPADKNSGPEDPGENSCDNDMHLLTNFSDREEHSKQMVRVLYRRLQALIDAVGESALTHSDSISEDNACPCSGTSYNNDQDGNIDVYSVNPLAYRNPDTPHTDAEKRIESLFGEYEEESEAHQKKYMLKRKSSRKINNSHDLVDRERRRKKLKSLQAIAESNSTKFLSRSPNSVTYRVNGALPIPINELNPALFLEMSVEMIQHPGTRNDIEILILHETSEELLVHAFWLCHVQFFQKNAFREQTYLQNKIASSYPNVIRRITQAESQNKRDILFRTYPLVLAKSIYLAFTYLLPGGSGQFMGPFQRVLSHLIFCMFTGVAISKDSVDTLRQKLYHDQFDTPANTDSTKDMNHVVDDSDLPRQQQRIMFDAYKITPLLQKYIGGDIPTRHRTMLKRTLPSEQCQVGGVCTYRPTRIVSMGHNFPDDESRMLELRAMLKKRALAINNIDSLHKEQQNLLSSSRKARSEFVSGLLAGRH